MTELELLLKRWNIPLVEEVPALKGDVYEFLMNWCAERQNGNLLLVESSKTLTTDASADVAAWMISIIASNKMISSFPYHINGIALWARQDTTLPSDILGKIDSCDLLWIEELAGGNLTEHQRTLLYAFLLKIKQRDRAIITVSTSVEQLFSWVGEVISKILARNFQIVQV